MRKDLKAGKSSIHPMNRFFMLLLIALLLNLQTSKGGVSLGVSPGMLNFQDMLRGGYAERAITISTSKEIPVLTTVKLEKGVKDWVSLRPNVTRFNISRSAPFTLTVVVKPSANAENGNYTTNLHIRTEKLTSLTGVAYGSVIKADVNLKINIEITGRQIMKCYVAGVDVKDTEEGYPIAVYAYVSNQGNVIITPSVKLFVWDKYQKSLLVSDDYETEPILPTTKQREYIEVQNNLTIGQYWIKLSVPQCNFQTTKTFDVLKPGEISDKGELVKLNTKPWAEIGELVPIIGIFKNIGPRPVTAKLKIEIKKQGKIMKAFETEAKRVLDGDIEEFREYFIPEEPGRYEVNAVAEYNNKLSFEKGSIINVKPAEKEKQKYSLIVAYIIITLVIVGLVRKIYNAKKNY